MRNTFAETLYKAARSRPDVYIVVADISPAGSMAKFGTEFPERFINVGVAEQSMIGICAGMALKGCSRSPTRSPRSRSTGPSRWCATTCAIRTCP